MNTQILSAVILTCASFPIVAATTTVVDPVSGLTFKVTTTGKNVTGVDFYGGTIPADGVVDIPESITYEGVSVPVTGIAADLNAVNPSFKSTVSSLLVPSAVASVSPGLFAGYTALKNVDFAGSTDIGAGAFRDCSELSGVTLGAGITSIPDSCFMNCAALTEITLPESLETIGTASFSHTGLTEAVIPGNVSDVGDDAYRDCPLVGVTIQGGSDSPVPTEFGNYAFSASSLERVISYRPVPPVLYGTGTTFKMSTYKNAYLQLLGDAQDHVADYEADKYWGWFGQDKPIYTGISGTESDRGMQCEVYDLNGTLVMKAGVKSLSGLPKGIYVVNGRKVVI